MFPGFALIVSVDCTSPDGSSQLARGIKADGDDIESLLSSELCSYQSNHVTRLDGADATSLNVKDALDKIVSEAGSSDPVFVFFLVMVRRRTQLTLHGHVSHSRGLTRQPVMAF